MGKCIYPRTIRRVIYGKVQGITIPCGKCVECLQRKRQEWVFRLLSELKDAKTCYFITFTYDDQHLPMDDMGYYQLDKRHVQLFFKRLRKEYPDNHIRYFLCGEYGTHTFRPHYHAIIFNLPLDNTPSRIKLTKKLETIWQKGHVDIGDTVNGAAINYCAKYIMYKHSVSEHHVKPFILTSRRPGLGSNYINSQQIRNYHQSSDDNLAMVDGCKLPLPRYYSTKIFSEKELEERYYRLRDKQEKEMNEKIEYEFRVKNYHERSIDERNAAQAREANEKNKLQFLTKSRNTL